MCNVTSVLVMQLEARSTTPRCSKPSALLVHPSHTKACNINTTHKILLMYSAPVGERALSNLGRSCGGSTITSNKSDSDSSARSSPSFSSAAARKKISLAGPAGATYSINTIAGFVGMVSRSHRMQQRLDQVRSVARQVLERVG